MSRTWRPATIQNRSDTVADEDFQANRVPIERGRARQVFCPNGNLRNPSGIQFGFLRSGGNGAAKHE